TLQDNLQNLENARKEAQHEISFSKVSQEDLNDLDMIIKDMYIDIGGLALSGVIEGELMGDGQEGELEIRIDNCENESILDQRSTNVGRLPSLTNTIGTLGSEEDLTRLLGILRPICIELSNACQLCLMDCVARIQHNFCEPWYKKWSPFYRKPVLHHYHSVTPYEPSKFLKDAAIRFNKAREEGLHCLFADQQNISPSPQRVLLLLLLFENNLKDFSRNLGHLVNRISFLEATRKDMKFWIPSISFLKRRRNDSLTDEDGLNVETQVRNDGGEEEEEFEEFYGPDPDVTPPSTPAQRFWYGLWKVRNWFNSEHARFACKNAFAVTCLSLPAFLPNSSAWFDDYRGQWALVSAVLSFSPTLGGAVLQFFGRLLGSCIGALMAIVAWNITQGNAFGLAAILFVFSLTLWFTYLNSKVWTVGGIIMLVNFPLVLANVYQAQNGVGRPEDTLYTIAAKRTSAVSIGITSAFIMMMFPWPHAGRVEVRYRLARTIANLGVLYSMTVSMLLREPRKMCFNTAPSFTKLVAHVKRSIAAERLLLLRTVYEPPLRGRFPMEHYEKMIDIVEHMVNLISGLEHTLRELNGTEWKTDLADVLDPSKCHYITHILTSFYILATALENRVPLPPYNIVASVDTQFGEHGLGERISKRIRMTASELKKQDLETRAYICYCTYLIKTSHLVNELLKLVTEVKKLVGVNRYVKELCRF
ncbi:65_t:CDS:2, partial [Acaulospora morrowiae]